MQFEFCTADRILFGPGTLSRVAPAAAEMGDRVLLVVGRDTDRSGTLIDALKYRGMSVSVFSVQGEPTTETAAAGLEIARKAKSTLVIGMGGGSVVDAGKVIAALLTNIEDMTTYLEVVGEGKPIQVQPEQHEREPGLALGRRTDPYIGKGRGCVLTEPGKSRTVIESGMIQIDIVLNRRK